MFPVPAMPTLVPGPEQHHDNFSRFSQPRGHPSSKINPQQRQGSRERAADPAGKAVQPPAKDASEEGAKGGRKG